MKQVAIKIYIILALLKYFTSGGQTYIIQQDFKKEVPRLLFRVEFYRPGRHFQ